MEILGKKKKKGKARNYYKLLYDDFIDKYKDLHIDQVNKNKDIYDGIIDFMYGTVIQYKQLTSNESKQGIKKKKKNISPKNIFENIRDTI